MIDVTFFISRVLAMWRFRRLFCCKFDS